MRPGFEPGTSCFPVLSVTAMPLVGPNFEDRLNNSGLITEVTFHSVTNMYRILFFSDHIFDLVTSLSIIKLEKNIYKTHAKFYL